MRRPMDVVDNIHSHHYIGCYTFGLNPDLEELKRYNQEAAQRECPHQKVKTIERDDGMVFGICEDCRMTNPPSAVRLR